MSKFPSDESFDRLQRLAAKHAGLYPNLGVGLEKYVREEQKMQKALRSIAGESKILQAFEALNKQRDVYARFAEVSRAWESSKIVLQMSEFQKALESSKLRYGLNALAGGLESGGLASKALQLANTERMLVSQFREPLTTELENFAKAFADNSHWLENFSRTMQKMNAAWVNIENPLASFRGVSELSRIGLALKAPNPFDSPTTSIIRNAVGDWREGITLSSPDILVPNKRIQVYESKGFNRELTEFPPETFEEAASTTGVKPQIITVTLDTSIIAEFYPTAENQEAYKFLSALEQRLRRFIESRMLEKYGEHWATQRVPAEIVAAWRAKKEKDTGKDLPLIEYIDFTDYVRVITRKDNWNDLFKDIFIRSESVQESFFRLFPLRLCVMHGRAITEEDKLLLYVEVGRLFKLMDSYEKR